MKYCQLSDIQQELTQFTFSATTKPTSTQVDEYIREISEDIIEPQIRVLANLPITDESGLKYLKTVTVNGVITKIYRSLQHDPEIIRDYQKLFDDGLKRIRDNPNVLIGDTESDKQPGATSSYDSSRETRFPRDERQW